MQECQHWTSIGGPAFLGNVGRGVLVRCRNASTGPALVGLPWPIFQNYNGPLLASHDGASMAASTGPSKVICIRLIGGPGGKGREWGWAGEGRGKGAGEGRDPLLLSYTP